MSIISNSIKNYFHHIDQVAFSIMSPFKVKEMSVCHITNVKLEGSGSLYDKRMGAITTRSICETCGLNNLLCTGHFGHIELNTYILHPLYISTILQCLHCICFDCLHCLIDEDQLPMFCKTQRASFSILCNVYKSFHYCMNCHAEQPRYVLDKSKVVQQINKQKETLALDEEEIYLRLKKIPDWFCNLCSISRPEYLILTVLPVLPPISRPPVVSDSMTCDDDLTLQYLEILKTTIQIGAKRTIFSKKEWSDIRNTLGFRIHCLMDNSSGKAKHTNQRAFKGIRERLAGKDGLLRNNLMGKRVDYSARTVIGPDPSLQLDEIGLPPNMMNTLIYRETVTCYNKETLTRSCLEGQVVALIRNDARVHLKYALATEKQRQQFYLQLGDILERRLIDGDIVLANRQPTLHKGSMLAFRARQIQGKTIRLNLAITSTFNADFDGDEMNVHVPMNPLSKIELQALSSIQSNFLSTQTGNPLPTFVQDCVVGMYLLSHETLLSPSVWMNLLHSAGLESPEVKSMSGLECSSYLLPPALRPVKTIWTKRELNSMSRKLAQFYSVDIAIRFVSQTQFLANAYLLYRGFSIGIRDCIPLVNEEHLSDVVSQCLFRAQVVSESDLHPYVKEQRINQELTKTRDMAMRLGKTAIESSNRFVSCLESGSKGDYFNFMQVSCLLGQQNVNGHRMNYQLLNGQRALPHYKNNIDFSEQVESKGFIQHSFLEGLSPKEYWFHAVSGREGVTNTAMKTANSGYAQRKMVKLMEDLQVRYDYTIRTASQHIVQFEYNDGFSTTMRPWDTIPLFPNEVSSDDQKEK